LLYGRVDMSDFVNVVKREGFAVKEVRYHLRDPGNENGVLDPLLVGAAGTLASLKVFYTTTAYENIADVGIASPDVISLLEMTSVQFVDAISGVPQWGQNQWNHYGTPDLHPDGYNVVSDLLIGIGASVVSSAVNQTLEIDIMIIGEPVKLNEADMTEMLTQGQDL
ncbi:unnamed protein product, partial [marine sediment metagenome]